MMHVMPGGSLLLDPGDISPRSETFSSSERKAAEAALVP
jgi:hypothetical protein